MNDEAYIAISRLQRAYADVSTRHAWDEMEALATPDARFCYHTKNGLFEVQGGAAFAELGPRMSEQFSFHLVVEFDGDDKAHGRSYLVEFNEERDSRTWNEIFGTYEDDYVLHDGAWRFSRREYSPFGRRSGGQLESFPLPDTWL
jgi:SnoaL-like domain